MHNRLLIAALLLAGHLQAQSKLSVGQYAYIRNHQPFYISPVVQYQDRHNWYAEARYNYEELNTCSLYGGHTFSGGDAWPYSITPMAGVMLGKLQGVSAGINAELGYKRLYFSTQSQYCVSAKDPLENFFFSWSELGYHGPDWLYTGLSLQYTLPWKRDALIEPGVFASFSYRQWSVPVYYFMPAHESSYLVVGVIHEWKFSRGSRIRTNKPSFPKRGRGSAY